MLAWTAATMAIEYIPNHVERGLARLISQYATKTLFRAWIASYLGLVQEVEDALWEVLTLRNLDGTGIVLDYIGKIVNRPRGDLIDDDYRIALRAEIRVLRSDGTMRDIIEVARLAIPPGFTFTADDEGVATIRFVVNEPITFDAYVLFLILSRTKAGGVRLLYEISPSALDLYFVWAGDDSTADIGFGDTTSSVGGLGTCVLGA